MLIHHNLIMIDINQSPVLCPHTYKTNYQLNILTNIQANSLLCRPTLIHYLLQSRLIKKMQWQTWPFFFEICTEVSFTSPELMWMQIMKLPYTEVKFYPEKKTQTGLSSLQVSCKCGLRIWWTAFAKKFKQKEVFIYMWICM